MMRNEVCNAIREVKKRFEYRFTQNIKDDRKTFYAYVRPRSKSKNEIGSWRWKNKTVDDDGGKAGLLNAYFEVTF